MYDGATMPSVGSWVPLVIIAAVVSALALHASVYAPTIREKAARLLAEEIDQEDGMLCEKLGASRSTDRFAACADILAQARRNEATRVARDALGIL